MCIYIHAHGFSVLSIIIYFRNGYVRSLTYDIIEPDSMCTLSEYCVLRELIWLLYVPTTPNICKIFYRDKHNVFRVHNNVTLPSLLPVSIKANFCFI